MPRKRKRPVPLGRSMRFQKLKALSCYQEMYDRICAGWPIAQVARFIQQERNEYTEITQRGLEQQLVEFRKQMPPGDLVQKRFPELYDKAKDKVEEGIDELAELEDLYRIQMARIKIDYATEKGIKKLLPSMTGEIREARQILETITNLKMDLGVLDRARRGVDVNVDVDVDATLTGEVVGRFSDDGVNEVLNNPESRRKVMGVVERFMKLPASTEESN